MKSRDFTPEEREFIDQLLPKLPPAYAREEAPNALPGLFAYRTLANADDKGEGPLVAWKIGKKVCYPTKSLLEWIVRKWGVRRLERI